ncbi:hypothetical protein [uncultured Shewanella sp.]|uniref:hypothetical protein n=1 Tax=uncultured Shewanella sp. TaxID=173975 RepID=UPI002603BC1E|nr:hypothetical protein [uncultured Shewanella sp.]
MESVKDYLRKKGPSLSSDITEYLISKHGILPATARQRVSRASKEILKLELSFPRNAKFLFLREQSGSDKYWSNLVNALLKTKSAYGYALTSLMARDGITPLHHFDIVCGAPIKQKKHLSTNTILQRLLQVNLIKTIDVPKIGNCVYIGFHSNHVEDLFPQLKARLLAEDILLRGFSSWLKRNNFISYNQVKTREQEPLPIVSTTAWDLCGPSYLSPLIAFNPGDTKPKPGFVTCDVLIKPMVSKNDLQPYIQKVKALRGLKNVGKSLHFFIAYKYSEEAFALLKGEGISPATIDSIFGKEVSNGISHILNIFTEIIPNSGLDLASLDKIYNILGKVEGAASRIRGVFFEYLAAEVIRTLFTYHSINMNYICKTENGQKEADIVYVTKNNQVIFVEAKGYNPRTLITEKEVNYWLTEQVPIFYKYCQNHPDWKNKKLVFKYWTTSDFNEGALLLLNKMKNQVSPKKYTLEYSNGSDIQKIIKDTDNSQLNDIYNTHYMKHPFNKI